MTTAFIAIEALAEAPREHVVEVVSDDGATAVVRVDGTLMTLALQSLADGRVEVRSDASRRLLRVRQIGEDTLLVEGGEQRRYQLIDERDRWLHIGGQGDGSASGEVRASMPGRVVRLPRAVGDVVVAGDVVAVLEAMKMENDVKARIDGTIAEIAVAEGDAVEQKALLLRIEALQ